jgi:two-component system CheB/CheR fusion protein
VTTEISETAAEPADLEATVRRLEYQLAAAEAEIDRLRALLGGNTGADPADDRTHSRSHALLAAVVTASYDAIVSSDEQHRIITWNPGAERIFGYTASEAMGQRFSDLLPADEPDRRRDEIMSAVRAGATLSFIARRRRKDGSLVSVETIVSPLRDTDGTTIGITSISRDISDRLTAQQQLRDLERRYQTFFEKMPGLTYIYTPFDAPPEQRIDAYSPRFTEVTGYAAELWKADPELIFKIAHPDDRHLLLAEFKRVATSGDEISEVCVEFRIITPDGRVLWVRDQANLVYDDEGHAQYWLGFMLDISQQKLAEEATANALERLEASNRDLARLSAAKSDFVSTISHEFRTPLTSILGFSELLESEALSPAERRDFAGTINQSALRLSRMVGDVLDLDALEAGHHAINLSQLDLGQLVTRTLTTMRPVLAEHQVTTDCDPDLPLIRGDAELLLRVLTNLVANAVKYSPTGSTITISLRALPGTVELCVADQGLGIPPEDRERIFTRYGRIDRPEQVGVEGTGLGLPIASQVAELHGGKIEVRANQPAGAVFCLTLPVGGPP